MGLVKLLVAVERGRGAESPIAAAGEGASGAVWLEELGRIRD